MPELPFDQPDIPIDNPSLALEITRRDAEDCQACPLWEIGTQTVFGTGPTNAALMFIGEAPGAQEDQSGVPFVGPAGQVFDEALSEVGIRRDDVYLTNTVKHRPSVETASGRRKNRAPKQNEIKACAPWLDRELTIVNPSIICCLGAVAAKRILGRDFRLMDQRGQWFSADVAPHVLATVHPSFVLIQPSDSRDRWWNTFLGDLRQVRERLAALERR